MEKKFTKGTWVIDSDFITVEVNGIDEVVCDLDPEGVWPTVYQRSEKEKDANAKLIAAAPELLEACQWALMQFEILNDKGLYPTHLLSVNGGDGLMTIIKAINKATK